MYLRKIASAKAVEEKIDSDLNSAKDKVTDFITPEMAYSALLLTPTIVGAATDKEGKPFKGALKGLGLTAGSYAGFKGGKALANHLNNTSFMQGLTPEQRGLARLATIAAGTGLGAKLGWSGVESAL